MSDLIARMTNAVGLRKHTTAGASGKTPACTFNDQEIHDNLFEDAIHHRLDGVRPHGTSEKTVGKLSKLIARAFKSNRKKTDGNFTTQFPGIARSPHHQFEITLSNQQTVMRTKEEASLHVLLQSQVRQHDRDLVETGDALRLADLRSTARKKARGTPRPLETQPMLQGPSSTSSAPATNPLPRQRTVTSHPAVGQSDSDTSVAPGIPRSVAPQYATSVSVPVTPPGTSDGASVSGAPAASVPDLAPASPTGNPLPLVPVPEPRNVSGTPALRSPSPEPEIQPISGQPGPSQSLSPDPQGDEEKIGKRFHSFSNKQFDMEAMEEMMHFGSHNVKQISNENAGGWWRTSWISTIMRHHEDPAALEHVLLKKLSSDLTPELRTSIAQVRQIAEAYQATGLREILTGLELANYAADMARPSRLKLPGEQDFDGKAGDEACHKITEALLRKAGISQQQIDATLDGNEAGHVVLGSILMRQLESDFVVYNRNKNNAGSWSPGLSTVCIRTNHDSRLSKVTFSDDRTWFAHSVIHELKDVGVMIRQGREINLCFPRDAIGHDYPT